MEQELQYNQNEPQVPQEEYQTPKKSFLRFYMLGGVVMVVLLIDGAFFVFDKDRLNLDGISAIDTSKPSTADLQVNINETGPFDSTQDVSLGDEVTLTWNSTNANFCTLNGRQVDKVGSQRLFGQLEAGEEATLTVQCGDATDSIILNVGHYKLTDFEKADNRWVDRFDTTNIPTDSYRAYYFNSLEPNKVVKTEVVPKVAIDYHWSDANAPNIKADDFGGYWIGKQRVDKAGVYSLVVSLSWSEARVIIDGYEIPSGTETKIELDKGVYQVEVEYLNNRGGVDFLVALEPEKKTYSLEEVRKFIGTESTNYDVWYVGSYEGDPVLNINSKPNRPTILVLDSYSANQWVVNNAASNNIAYILYSSYEPGASVESDLNAVNILSVEDGFIPEPDGYGRSKIDAECWTDDYPPRCDNVYTVSNLNSFAKNNFGGSLTGFTEFYGADNIQIPQVTLSEAKITEIQRKNDKIKSDAEARAKREAGASVETLFSNTLEEETTASAAFPDVSSCLESQSKTPSTDELMKMNWSQMKTNAQVEICMFHILSALGDADYATPWLEAQGFTSGTTFTSSNPYVGIDGSLNVHANWNVSKNGFRWPETGIKRHILALPIFWPPYGISIATSWSSDGKELLYVGINEMRL